MARSKFRLFHLILEICKSRLSHFCSSSSHWYVHIPGKLAGIPGICGNLPGSLILNIRFFFHGAFDCYSRVGLPGPFGGSWGTCVGCWVLCQRTIPSHDKLGISSSTASPLLNFAGRTRNFWVSLLVRSSFGSWFWSGRVRFYLCSFHFACCFSCTQLHRIELWTGWLRLLGIRWTLPICVLPFAEGEAEQWSARYWEVGGIHASKSFVFWGNQWRTHLGGDASSGIPWKNYQQLPPQRVP